MPCYSVAVLSGKLEPRVAEAILASDRALEGLRLLVEQNVTDRPVTVQVAGDRRYAVISAGQVRVAIRSDGFNVTDYRERTVSFAQQSLADKIEAQAKLMAVAIEADKTVESVKAIGAAIKSDVTSPAGVRSVSFIVRA